MLINNPIKNNMDIIGFLLTITNKPHNIAHILVKYKLDMLKPLKNKSCIKYKLFIFIY